MTYKITPESAVTSTFRSKVSLGLSKDILQEEDPLLFYDEFRKKQWTFARQSKKPVPKGVELDQGIFTTSSTLATSSSGVIAPPPSNVSCCIITMLCE